jgi:ABC-type Na+ efflux pump permease subunit
VTTIHPRPIATIVRRDLTVVARSRAVMLPILILPLVMFVILPLIVGLAVPAGGEQLNDFEPVLAAMPESIRSQLGNGPLADQILVYFLEYQFVTLFLIVPLMVASVIAADSFAGEKERKTLEALLYTPTTDAELFLGKALGPWLAAVIVATVSYGLYVLVSNLVAGPLVGRPVVVTPLWLITLFWISPGTAALALGILVQVSARVRGFQEAYQLGGLVVLPLVVLLIAQLAGVLFLDALTGLLIGVVVWLIAAAVLRIGFRSFQRERLLTGG